MKKLLCKPNIYNKKMSRISVNKMNTLGVYSGMQQGNGKFMDFLKGVANNAKGINKFLKDNKVGSKLGNVTDALGVTSYLDSKTGGKYSQGIDFAKKKGYGKKRRTRRKK